MIELLVVISIISLLSSIVLASLGTARAKAADAAIKSNLISARTQAEIIYSVKGCYTNSDCSETADSVGFCPVAGTTRIFGEPNIAAQIAAAKLASGSHSNCANRSVTSWSAAVVLKTDQTKAWCVDSNGASKQIDNGALDYTPTDLTYDIFNSGEGARCGT